jgi:hypothetical protein
MSFFLAPDRGQPPAVIYAHPRAERGTTGPVGTSPVSTSPAVRPAAPTVPMA